MHIYIVLIVILLNFLGANSVCENLYEQSTAQAFYLVDTVLINGHPIDSEDFLCVVAYKNDICVGARLWDPSSCGKKNRLHYFGVAKVYPATFR